MSFLRSIIADARPHKPIPESNTRQQLTPQLQTAGLNQGVAEVKPKSPDSPNPTNHISTSTPMLESASGEVVADVSVVQEGNPINLDNPDAGSDQLDNEQTAVQNSPEITVTPTDIKQSLEPSNMLTETQDVQYRAFDEEPTESEQTNTNGRSVTDTEEQVRLSDVLETKPVKMTENLIVHDEYTQAIVTDDRQLQDQIDPALQTQSASYRHDSDTRLHQTEVTLMASKPLPEVTKNTLQEKVIVSPGIEVDGKTEGLNEPQVSNKLEQVRRRTPIFDNSKSWKHTEDVLLNDGITNQVSSGIKKKEKMENVSKQDDASRIIKKAEPESVYHEIQLSPKQTVISQKATEQEHNSNSQLTVKQATVSSSKPKPVVAKPENSERHSNNREAFPTVPAKVFQADLIPKAFEHRQSRPSYAPPGKRHETPAVQIGQIDVIIEMPAKPASKPTAALSSTDMASRNYLRRL